ncbi:MAG: glycosyltransferase family 4 protein [Gemmatimonadales bacterium]
MSAPLTILHLTHQGHGAGSSISIALLARAQVAAGHRVLVGCPGRTYLAGLVQRSRAELVPIPFVPGDDSRAEVERIAREERVDVVNAHSSRDRAACRQLRLAGRLPGALVMTRRGMPMSTPISAVLSGFAADRTIAVSRPVARALVRRGTPPWRVSVVHNAVDLPRIDGAVTRPEAERVRGLIAPDGRPVIGVVARRKDHDTLLRALHFVRTPVVLCVVGFAPDPALARLTVPPGHRVVWLDFQADVRPFYDAFDLVALSGRHEGFSQGLLEAMALGKPVVATRAGGNTDAIEHGVHGLLVRPRDPSALGTAIQRVLDDSELGRRLGEAARRRAREEFTVERTVLGTESVYRAAIARRTGARA